MLRNKGLADKMILLGLDGMDPYFTRHLVDEGKMPNVKKLMEMGACRDDLMLLGAVPTITPPMWATLATGAYPMTHGIQDFQIANEGDLAFNYIGLYSTDCKAEQLWNVTAEAGLKTLVWHWPGGSWPPSSDSENLMVVDGTSPGALGFSALQADMEFVSVASNVTPQYTFVPNVSVDLSKINGDPTEVTAGRSPYVPILPKEPYWKEFRQEYAEKVGHVNGYNINPMMDFRFNMLVDASQMATLADGPMGVSYSPFTEPEGWAGEVPEGAKEFMMGCMFGQAPKPCLLLKNEQGVYDKVAVYDAKQMPFPNAVLEQGVMTQVVGMGVNMKNLRAPEPKIVKVYRNMRLMEVAEDGSILKIWVSAAMDLEDKSVFYPQWIHDEVYEKFGYPAPTSMAGSHDKGLLWDCSHEQWRQTAMWQADALTYMMDEHGVDVIFSHYHGPDMEGHEYMKYLKERSNSPAAPEELYERAVATYTLADEYIGRFIPYIDKGYVLNIFSDHSLVCRNDEYHPFMGDNYGLNTGVMTELGYMKLIKDEKGRDVIDWENTRAVQNRSNSIFINLKGRDLHGIVDPADKYELEEQIITDLYAYKAPTTGKRVVSLALHNKDAVLLGLGGDGAADIIFFLHDDYVHDHGESLSTATGAAHTTTSPIYLIAGPGIKQNYRTNMYIREVDVAPTAAVLLGVRIPAQCEGAPAYQLLTEEL